jgi:hypothetical protein
MVQEIGMNEPQMAREPSTPVEERVEHEKARRRRRWVLYSLFQLIFLTILIGLLVVWQRDAAVVKTHIDRLEQPAEVLQANVNKWEFLPVTVPGMGEKFSYVDNATRLYAINSEQPVIIAFTSRIDRKLRKDGRAVIMYENREDGPHVYTRWMSAPEFRQTYLAQEKRIEQFQEKRFSSGQ